MSTAPKFDPAPLVAAAGDGVRAAARRLEVDPAVLCRPLSVATADRLAVKLGWHPIEIWGADVWWADE